MKIIFTLVFLSYFINVANSQIKVIDSITKKHVPYVAIRFDENNGIFTNNEGEFNLTDVTKDSIFLSSPGYRRKVIDLKTLDSNLIYLSPVDYVLEEVAISNKNKKSKTKRVKPIKHNDFLKSHRLIVGEELAIYIPNNYNSDDIEFKSLLIPIITKTISFDKSMAGKTQRVKKLPFSAMYKISFYENLKGSPGDQINYEDITIVINEKSTIVNFSIEKYNISLPHEGVFIGILNLGKTDRNGKLISTSPFEMREDKNGTVKFVKPTKPNFPVHYKEKINNTFSRYTFEEDKEWKTFYKHGKIKKGEYHNISLGYEIKIY